ncbi:type II toxin-antitoxin system VapC family toxin [Mesorhizobium sp. BR1-1-16]|uniref:type II toxin-antitoxin system VapC family toxin n=1 Tax=Mesorhizobium sp. BR1-1-16 TaxID=2876653 RepID=UPI001CCECE81|nr:type II toxin-antitoxin system VapC family toxin [Mesorhizobium sp. BR1-1-16]MBZ9934991.1 type II toxin-antitoxin system VapC family toxin [Mesorhizobium sp. BR1-1-16]
MVYFDTSFLVPLVLPEETSGDIVSFMVAFGEQAAATSHWTRVEFASLVARQVRMQRIDANAAARTTAGFEALIEGRFTVILPGQDDFDLARRYLAQSETGLRGGDALHLAIAANRNAERIFTLDKGFARAGTMLGLPVSGLAAS